MESEAKILLDDAASFCQRDGVDLRLAQMLAQCKAVEFIGESLAIEAPSRFAIAYLERNRPVIEGYLEQIAFMPVSLKVMAPSGIPAPIAQPTQAAPVAPAAAPSEQSVPTAMPAAAPQNPAPQNEATGEAKPVGGFPWASPAQARQPWQQGAAGATTPFEGAAVAPKTAQQFAPAQTQPMTPQTAAPQPQSVAAPLAHELDPQAVRVKSTLSRDEYLRMVGKAPEPAASGQMAAPSTPAEPERAPSLAVSSKFTFDTFVYGDENKHAYQSAQRFAAFVEEPGQYDSLFIYGSSGLGKTHLLMAITNYLAQHKPHIRVKYANSQAYIDDFINEIARQKTESRAILREYHEADVLIIDDIQNIIGKQASIEYFFSLMDEFIRERKKVVIASDRAPKNLGMDERLTSRFNAGMLCLVSEPGFEMKYTILRRYYDTIIAGGEGDAPSVDASLLGAFQGREGKLTDEQLRHMAEISGNNIRELESFCERCAGLSAEREQAGTELTGEDIERVADEYFDTVRKVIHVDTIQGVVEEFYHVSHEELIGPKRSRDIAFARHVAVYLANSMCDLSSKAIGEEFGGRDHSTVINSLKVVEKKIKEDRRVAEDLQQLKNKITLRS